MKFFYTSDLHFDVSKFNDGDNPLTLRAIGVVLEEYDGVIIAGDLTTHGNPESVKAVFDELKEARMPTVMVLGNHDYYGSGSIKDGVERWTDFLRENDYDEFVTLLHTQGDDPEASCGTFLRGVLVVGDTLWTDAGKVPVVAAMVDAHLPDSTYIDMPGSSRGFRSVNAYAEHLRAKDAISGRIYQEYTNNGYIGEYILVTHHCPTRECIHPQYLGKDDTSSSTMISRGFFTDGEPWLKGIVPDYIICGHTHRRFVKQHSKLPIMLLMNAHGYPSERSIPSEAFSPSAYLEV